MDLERREYGSVAVIKLGGRLDSVGWRRAERAVGRLIPANGRVLLDLSRVTYLSSTGLRALLLAYREATAAGATIALAGMQDEIREIMTVTGFLDLFTVADTVPGGIDALSHSARGPHASRVADGLG